MIANEIFDQVIAKASIGLNLKVTLRILKN